MEKKYSAFISYSRKDLTVARWLHTKLEKYPYPQDLTHPDHRPYDDKRFRPVFLDLKDLSPTEHPFNETIKGAIANAKFLILLCSANAAKSQYVDKEVHYFLKTHNNDYVKIVPIFIDRVDYDTIPPCIFNTPVMERHFPIYNTTLRPNSEANLCCFYQAVAYLLGTDFNLIYDRYEQYAIRKRRRFHIRIALLIVLLLAIIVEMFFLTRNLQQKVEAERRQTEFEKRVYPKSIVMGYHKNFLQPVINYLKASGSDFHIMILMPTNEKEIDSQQKRLQETHNIIAHQLGIDSLSFVTLNTDMKRGSKITVINSSDSTFSNVYLDFATTTSSFKGIAEYKRQNEYYKQTDINELINEYAQTFIAETNEELGADSVYVEFYTTRDNLIHRLKTYKQNATRTK